MIKAELMDGGRKIKILEDLVVHGLVAYVVPGGFICDYASVPRVLWSMIPPMGSRYTKAAILHDWMYAKHYTRVRQANGNVDIAVTRKTADLIFKRAMIDAKVRRWRVHSMYWAVRLFGAKPWARSHQAT